MAKKEPIHTHEIKNYLVCKLLWFWTAPRPRGLNLEPDRPVVALDVGRLTHSALQEHYDKGTVPDVAFVREALREKKALEDEGAWEKEVEDMGESIETVAQVLRTYYHWGRSHDQDVRFIATETPWQVKYGGKKFAGRIDALIERPDGLWVLDFKTTGWTNTDWTEQDLQATMYVMAARKLYGQRVQGMIYRFLRKKKPWTWEQLILKRGGVTTRKDLADNTTYDNYRMAIAILALQPVIPGLEYPEYEAMLLDKDRKEKPWYAEFKASFNNAQRYYWQQLQDLRGVNNFIWEVEERRTDEQIHRYMDHVVLPAAKEMLSRSKKRWVGPTGLGNAWANCRRCRFKLPCQAVMAGADYKSLLHTQYHQREREEVWEE